jgi:signal transduction histidine kinase
MQRQLRNRLAATLDRPTTMRKAVISVAVVIIFLAVISLLLTRQIMYLDNDLQTLLFLLIVVIVFGIGSWVLLEYTKKTTEALRARSRFVSRTHSIATIAQFTLLGIMVALIIYNGLYCYDYFSFCSTPLFTVSLTAISSGLASVILAFFSYRFFSWYKSSNRNFILLFYGLATAALCLSIAGDAINKFVVTVVVVDSEVTSAHPDSSFVYNTFSKYEGDVKYRVTNPEGSTLYVAPEQLDDLYSWINYMTSYPRYVLLWISTCLLLHFYYQRIGQRITKFPIRYWILLAIPLVLYLIGSGLIFSLPDDSESRYYQRIIYRAGTIGSSVLFGVAFYIISRNVPSERVKDYLTISAIGITTVGVAFSVSAFQQTYGAAIHSLVFLSSYLFALGFYASAVFLTQDTKLRDSIRKTALRESELLVSVGKPHLEQELERRVLVTAQKQEEVLTESSGIQPSLTSREMKQYLSNVLSQITLLKDYEDIVRKEKEIVRSSLELAGCLNLSGIRLAYNTTFEEYKKVMSEKRETGEHKGIRIVTTITKDSAEMIKSFLEIGVQVRHIENLPPIDFIVSDKEIVAKVHKVEQNVVSKDIADHSWDIKNVLVSNEQAYIDYFLYTFSELWNNGSNASERIDCIERGLEPGFLEVINDGKKATRVLLELIRSIKEEAQILLPNEATISRLEQLGLIDLIKKVISGRKVRIKLIYPSTEINRETIKRLAATSPNLQMQNGNPSSSLIFIADGSKFLISEITKPSAASFAESIGFTLYSNTREGVESVKTFYDLLWKEHIRNQELKKADRLQKDFINIAAHELRTPIQPILGLSEIMYSQSEDPTQKRLLEVIVRNANRLRRLTENILDVNRIETNRLRLEKERFDMRQVIGSMIEDYRKTLRNKGGEGTNIVFLDRPEGSDQELIVSADLNRIMEVVSNLIDNALKFSKNGNICITARKHDDEIIVSVADSGIGIDASVFPNLFTKFTSRSGEGGTGLGLYISRNIIEAHNGRIWGENNIDGKGATFSFSLPVNG